MTTEDRTDNTTHTSYTATYSPDDNKLRLYSVHRLPDDVYKRITAAGFRRAPKQDLFVAPMWTPEREDVLLELCGEIVDEDTSLLARAEMRADQFEQYSASRARDADAAQCAAAAIADPIPFGQPILVGHHSEGRARKDAERIQNGMRRAIRMRETSKYWARRAEAAIDNAQYKAHPSVRQRRILRIEADKRKQERWITAAEQSLQCHQREGLSKPEQVAVINRGIARAQRWIAHYSNRLTYERAMLAAGASTAADKTKPEKGGGCVC